MGQRDTIIDLLQDRAERWPTEPWLEIAGEHATRSSLLEQSTELARGLRAVGVGPDEPVAIMLGNDLDAVRAWFAVNLADAYDVPVSPALRGSMLVHQLNDSTASTLIVDNRLLDEVAALAPRLEHVRRVLVRGPVPADDRIGIPMVALDDLGGAGHDLARARSAEAGLSTILYTGGTTGRAKGCAIGHQYLLSFTDQLARTLELDSSDTVWSPLPLFHINARSTVLATLVAGAGAVIDERFSVQGFWPAVQRSGATHARIIAGMFRLIADAPDRHRDPSRSSLRWAIGAGATADVAEIWRRRWNVIARSPGYGMTEASMIVSLPTIHTVPPPGAVGRPNDEFEVRVVDEHDHEATVGEPGEIVVRPRRPGVMFEGYWRLPEVTLHRCRNLWFHTGDIGRFTADGWLYFVGRKGDFIRRLGENVPAVEVEAAALEHPSVREAAAHAVDDPSVPGEEHVKLTAVLRDTATLSEQELCRFLAERLPSYAVPRYVELRGELPLGSVNRVAKHVLRREGVTPSTWERPPSRRRQDAPGDHVGLDDP